MKLIDYWADEEMDDWWLVKLGWAEKIWLPIEISSPVKTINFVPIIQFLHLIENMSPTTYLYFWNSR